LEFDRFACDNIGHKVASMGGVNICDPRHRLSVGAHVRCHDIRFRANEWQDFRGEPSRNTFLFTLAHGPWIAGYATFATSVGEIHQGAFPVHPHGKSRDFTEVHVGMKSETAFDRATREVVLDTVAKKDLCFTVVSLDGHGDGDEPFRPFTSLTDGCVKVEKIRGTVKLASCHLKDFVVK